MVRLLKLENFTLHGEMGRELGQLKATDFVDCPAMADINQVVSIKSSRKRCFGLERELGQIRV